MNLLLFCSSAALLLCLLWFVHSSELVRSGFRRFCVALLSCLLVFVRAAPAYADVATSSNAVLGLTPPEYLLSALSDDADAGIAPASSIGTVTNTPVFLAGDVPIYFRWRNTSTGETGTYQCTDYTASSSGIRFKYRTTGNIVLTGFYIILKDTGHDYMPPYGSYSFSADLTSQFSFAYGTTSSYKPYFWSQKQTSNASNTNSRVDMDFASSSGDFYVAPQTFNYTSAWYVSFGIDWGYSQNLQNFDATIHLNFAPVSADASAPTLGGVDTSESDTQNEISNNTSQIANSVSNMSSDLSDAAESLEYISQSQNLIIQGIDNVIMHISDQLYAFWDQLYNLIHEPTYARLGEILAALKAIANNSDISAVVDQIQESTEEQTDAIIANNNANTAKVEEAVEKHGNFIIEGLKSLFIPSDEYFESWFDGMYDFFHDRLGFLMLPIDILIEFIELFQDAGTSFSGIPFPEFKWIDGTVIIPAQTVQFTFLETDWGQNIQQKLYFVGDVIMIGALLALMHRKLEGVLRG